MQIAICSISKMRTIIHRLPEHQIKKLLRIMKVTAFLLLIGCLHVSAKTKAQVITLSFKDAPLEKVFAEIKKQTGYSFVYNNNLVANAKKVDLQVVNASVDEVLQQCLKDQPLTYTIVDKTIVIKPKQESSSVLEEFFPPPPIDVHGKVLNEKGEPLASVTVTIKGTRHATATDVNGEFTLIGVDTKATLVFSSTNVETYEVKVNGKTELAVNLKTKVSPLDEVQVIAYGTTTQRYSTGDVTTVKSEEIEKQPVSNVLAALEGRVPGLAIAQISGMPGSAYSVQIRGKNSLENGTDPFFVVDGVPYTTEVLPNSNPAGVGGGGPLNFINPDDIESISVLKDADATAIYGSRAANGAILIVTRKGKAGKTRLDFNVHQGVSVAPAAKTHWMNTAQYLSMRREAITNDGDSLTDPNIYAPDLLSWDTTRYTDWRKLLTGNAAAYTDAETSLSGGNSNTQFLIGANYHRESTVFPFAGSVPRGSIHINLNNVSANQRFRISVTASYLISSSHLPASDLSSGIILPPDAPPIYNKDGSLNLSGASWGYLGNPFAFRYQQYSASTHNLVAGSNLSYSLAKGLEILASLGYTNMQSNDISTSPIASKDPAFPQTGSANFSNNNNSTWIAEPQLSYKLYVGSSRLEALLGSTFEKNLSNGLYLSGNGFTSDALLENIQAAPIVTVVSTIYDVYKYNAFFGKLHYDYKDRYLVNLNWRRDGSSRFGPDNRFHNFGSVGLGYIFTNEDFFKEKLGFLSFGKLRGSYGTTGNDQIGDYRYLDLYSPTYITYQGTIGLNPGGLNNPDLAWEETRKLEIGLDLGFLKDKITINASYYRNRSSNQLVGTRLPAITGFFSVPENLPAVVQNSGWEFVVNTTNIKTKDFTWSTSFNLTVGRNKLIAFPNLATSPYANNYIVGKPISIIKVYQYAGVDPATGVYQFRDNTGKLTFNPTYGVDNNSIIDYTPKYFGGIENTFTYKRLAISMFFSFTEKIGVNYLLANVPGGLFGANQSTDVESRWQKPGDHSTVERFTQNYSSSAVNAYFLATSSTYNWVPAGYVRLKNVSLNYQLPQKWSSKMHLQNLEGYIQCQNLLTFTRFKGMDPESQSISSLPPLRTITGGIRIAL